MSKIILTKIVDIPRGAEEIIELLRRNGFEAYVVGGCVRDSLLGIKPKDWDICTSATPKTVVYFMNAHYIKVIETGMKHGTVTAIMEDGQYEITTFRVDGKYSDVRHPDVVSYTSNLIEDLSRRDFTMNAMAYNHEVGLVDPFGGAEDLWNNVVRCVGDPYERFSEDALRIMRCLRFVSTYGFGVHYKVFEGMSKALPLLRNISAERINSELCKILMGKYVFSVLMGSKDVITTVIPELKPCVGFDQNNRWHEYNVYDHIVHAVSNYEGDDIVVKLALLLHDTGKPYCYTENEKGGHFHGHGEVSRDIAETVMKNLRFDNKTSKDVVELVLHHDAVIEPTKKVVKKWMNKIGVEQFGRLLDVRMADILAHKRGTQESRIERCKMLRQIMNEIIADNECFKLKDLAITGNDVIACGVPEGKLVGIFLSKLLDDVISGRTPNTKDALLSSVKKYKKNLEGGC